MRWLQDSGTLDSGGHRADLWVVLAAASGPIPSRLALLLNEHASLGVADLAGLLSDCSVVLVFAAILGVTLRFARPAALVLSLFWGLIHYGDYEHVRELGVGLQFTFARYAADPAFLFGSALSPSNPLLLVLIVSLCVAFTWIAMRRSLGPPRVLRMLALAVVLTVASVALPDDAEKMPWRQHHFLYAWYPELRELARAPAARAQAGVPKRLAADLSGTPRIPLPGRGKNVLLLALERLPGTVLEGPAASAGSNGMLVMPRLTELAANNVMLRNFVGHQRQTNRGLYSLLCGDYPKLDYSIPRMTLYIQDSSRDCLPRVLDAAGYRTVYLQAAPLAFMYKDGFARRAGFQQIYGDRNFTHPILREYWGVDDKTLLRGTLKIARELESDGSPWFMSVLSVGTHTGIVPAGFPAKPGRTRWVQAIDYLDHALAEFVEQLRAQGILDDTLLIITADESRGDQSSVDPFGILSQSWTPLVMVLPEATKAVVDEPFGQSDVALSILDYLGIESRGTEFIGRSFFREYRTPRQIYFGNAFIRKTGGIDGSGFVFSCDEAITKCAEYASDPGSLFVPRSAAKKLPDASMERLREAMRYSVRDDPTQTGRFVINLVGDPSVPHLSRGEHLLMGGQNFNLPAHSKLDVDIVLEARGTSGQINLTHRFKEKIVGNHVQRQIRAVSPGERVEIRYSFATPREIPNIKLKLNGFVREEGDLSLYFQRAEATVTPSSAPIDAPGLVGEVQISRSKLRP